MRYANGEAFYKSLKQTTKAIKLILASSITEQITVVFRVSYYPRTDNLEWHLEWEVWDKRFKDKAFKGD